MIAIKTYSFKIRRYATQIYLNFSTIVVHRQRGKLKHLKTSNCIQRVTEIKSKAKKKTINSHTLSHSHTQTTDPNRRVCTITILLNFSLISDYSFKLGTRFAVRIDAESTARCHAVCNTAAASGGTTSFTERLHNKKVT